MEQRVLMGTELLKRVATVEISPVEVHVIAGPDRGSELALTRGSARIGTAPSNDLRLTDPTVSRLHLELEVRASSVRVVDAGSTNGTYSSGVQIHDATFRGGATLEIGETKLRIEVGDSPIHVRVSTKDHFGELIGGSVEMRRLFATMERCADSELTLLLQGETGTGKEIAARSIHEASSRRNGPFVTIDCGAIAENLMESELFGHTRGSFTGAIGERRGLLEQANGGTVFLDEIGEMPLGLQPKLLRALEAREVRPVGGNTPRKLDVRVIAATHRSLARAVNEGAFREDLYYRLAVVVLELPSLRGRREDITLLAERFYARAGGKGELPPQLRASLLARSWPGNVRELRNFMERAACLGVPSPGAPAPATSSVEGRVSIDLAYKEARESWMEQFDRAYVTELLARNGGNVTHAAQRAGLHRRTLQRVMANLGLRSDDGDDRGGG